METATAETVARAIEVYVVKLQSQHDEYMARHYPSQVETFSVNNGRRYAKVIRSDAGGYGASVVAFIDKNTGDIFKPDGWKKPAKYRRGNVLSVTNGMEAMTPSGQVAYVN